MNTPGSFPFAVLNDLHYMDELDRPWLEGMVRQVNAIDGLELVLVLGDLAELGTREELLAARDILTQLRVPYYTVPGNHDGPPGRPTGLGPAGLTTYNELFPNRRNYTFTHKNWQFLALDTTDGSAYRHLPLTAETRAYAAHAAATLDPQLPTILFTHFPLNPSIKYALSDGYDLLDILSPLNLRIVFSGHYHALTETPAPLLANRPHLMLLTNRCASRTRELEDTANQRGYFRCMANADGSVEYAFTQFTL